MKDDLCPSPEELKAYLLGQMRVEQTEEVARHVDDCPPCEDTVAALEHQSDTLLSGLRRQNRGKYAGDDDYRQALEFVKHIGRGASLAAADAGAATDDSTPPVRQLRDYELLEKLGEGGMGAVYKARHTKLDKFVAIKILPAERLKDAGAVARFEREMQAVGKLEHPNIVRAMDAGEVDGTHFLVMECVHGVDLSQLVRRHGPLPIAAACELIRQAAVGLDEAHDHKMVHRDIKPSNLMLARRRREPPIVKILDLGLALLSDGQTPDDGLTTSGQMMGTLDYLAPEQGGDSHDVDIRADIYALGASLYKLLTGKVVYHGKNHQTPVQKMTALATESAPNVQQLREEIPDGLAALVHRMLEKRPENRVATPAEVADALAPFCAGADLRSLVPIDESFASSRASLEQSSSATSTTGFGGSADIDTIPPTYQLADATPERSAATKAAVAERRRPARRRPATIAAALGILAVAAAMVFVFRVSDGVITVKVAEQYQDQISIKVAGKNGPLMISKENDFSIKLDHGTYTLELGEGNEQFQLSRQQVVVRDGDTEVVSVTLRKEPAGNSDTAGKSAGDRPEIAGTSNARQPEADPGGGAPSLAELDAAQEAGYRMMEIGEWEGVDGGITQDSSHLVVCDGQGQARVINFFTQEVVQTIDGIQPPLAFSETGTNMAAPIDDETIGVWDWQSGKRLKTHKMSSVGLRQLRLRSDGQVLVVRVEPTVKNVIELTRSDDPQPRLFIGHKGEIRSVDVSSDQQFLVSHSSAMEVKTWHVADRTVLYEGEWFSSFVDAAFAEDGKSFLIGGAQLGLARIDTLTGRQHFRVRDKPSGSGYESISISRNGQIGVSLNGGNLHLFSPATGVVWDKLSPTPFMRYSIASQFSPDGQFLALSEHPVPNAASSPRLQVRLYRLPTCRRPVPMLAKLDEAQNSWRRFSSNIGCMHVGRSLQGSITKDGRLATSVDHSGHLGRSVVVHDVVNGREVRRIDTSTIERSLISPDGKHVAHFHYRTSFEIIDVETGKVWQTPPSRWNGATFLSNGELFLAQKHGHTLSIFHVETGREIGTAVSQIEHGAFNRVATDAEGLRFAGVTHNGFVYLWEIRRELFAEPGNLEIQPIAPSRVFHGHQGGAYDAVFSGGGNRLITCGGDSKIIEWDLATGRQLRTMEELAVKANRLVVDGHDRVITGDIDGVLRIHDWKTSRVSFALPGHTGHIEDLRLSTDGRYALSCSQGTHGDNTNGNGGRGDSTGRYWRLPAVGEEPSAVAYQGEVKRIVWRRFDFERLRAAVVLPAASQAITVHRPEKNPKGTSIVRVWDVDAEQEIRHFEGHTGLITQLVVSRDERIVAAATDEHVYVWSADDGRLKYTLESPGPLAFSPDSLQLLSGGGRSPCAVWDVKSGEKIREIQPVAPEDRMELHHILPDLGSVASGVAGKGYLIWDWQSGRQRMSFDRAAPRWASGFLGCSSTGDRLLVNHENVLDIVDPQTAVTAASLVGHTAGVSGAKFFDDDRFVLTWGHDQTIRIWDVATRAAFYVNGEHRHGVAEWDRKPHYAADITPDRAHLLSVGDDGTIRKFRLPTEVIKRLRNTDN